MLSWKSLMNIFSPSSIALRDNVSLSIALNKPLRDGSMLHVVKRMKSEGIQKKKKETFSSICDKSMHRKCFGIYRVKNPLLSTHNSCLHPESSFRRPYTIIAVSIVSHHQSHFAHSFQATSCNIVAGKGKGEEREKKKRKGKRGTAATY